MNYYELVTMGGKIIIISDPTMKCAPAVFYGVGGDMWVWNPELFKMPADYLSPERFNRHTEKAIENSEFSVEIVPHIKSNHNEIIKRLNTKYTQAQQQYKNMGVI